MAGFFSDKYLHREIYIGGPRQESGGKGDMQPINKLKANQLLAKQVD